MSMLITLLRYPESVIFTSSNNQTPNNTMAHRINERNSGKWSLESEPKSRKNKGVLTEEEKQLTVMLLEKINECLEYDEALSDGKGRLNDVAMFSDGGRFTICMDRLTMESMVDIMIKLRR